MDSNESLEIIKTLAKGIDPQTGEEFSLDSPYLHPQTVRALYLAMEAIEQSNERAKKSEERIKNLPGNAGKAWDDEEDQRLIAAFEAGKSAKQIAAEHERTEGSICARLVRHGKI